MPKLRALIVDDEAPARLRVRELLARSASATPSGECATGAEAVAAIRDMAPDLLFLDVQMPGMDGFQVLREVGRDHLPVTVFVTAYDQYALAAFEAHALDYLLKPFSDERFERALERAIAQAGMRQNGEMAGRVASMLNEREASHMAVRVDGRVVLLKAGDIDWVEAAGVYVEIHAGRKVYLHRAAIGDVEAQLGPSKFVRIHRSTLVNLDRVRELAPLTHGEFAVILTTGMQLKMSRSYRHRLEQCLGQAL